jgi:hypothetical protein
MVCLHDSCSTAYLASSVVMNTCIHMSNHVAVLLGPCLTLSENYRSVHCLQRPYPPNRNMRWASPQHAMNCPHFHQHARSQGISPMQLISIIFKGAEFCSAMCGDPISGLDLFGDLLDF